MEYLRSYRDAGFIKSLFIIALLSFFSGAVSQLEAFTQVIVGSGTSESVETSFIAATTSQFNITLQKNPLASNTYTETLWGYNPKYNPPTPAFVLVDSSTWQKNFTTMITNSSYTYVYGWGDGSTYTRAQDAETASYYFLACKSTMTFTIPPPNQSTSTWVVPKIDSTTCQFVANYISNQIWGVSFSTPQIIPGLWQ